MRYIIVWRRSTTARLLDVVTDPGSSSIAVFEGQPDESLPLITTEADLVSYVNGGETDRTAVEASLAHRILGWAV